MNEIEKDVIGEIRTLHFEVVAQLKMTLPKAIRIGELLTQHKEKLEHGQFVKWVNDNLPFSDRTARNYMRLHREKDQLKTESGSVLGVKQAYDLLIEHREGDIQEKLEQWLSLLTIAKAYEVDEKEIENMDAMVLKKIKDWFEMEDRAHDFIVKLKPSLIEEIKNIQDITKLKRIVDLSTQCEVLCAERVLYAERQLGKCLIELKNLGVPESVWTTKGGVTRLQEQCEAEIARISQDIIAAESKVKELEERTNGRTTIE